jgi:hypothetical protein
MAKPAPSFGRLDSTNRDIAVLIGAMLQARQVVERRSWNTPQEMLDENWWMDVLADSLRIGDTARLCSAYPSGFVALPPDVLVAGRELYPRRGCKT